MEINKNNLRQRVFLVKEQGISYDGTYVFSLDECFCVWALIKASKPSRFYGHDGYQQIGTPTYDIFIKKNPKILLTSNGWIVQKPRISSQRNFKIINVFEYNQDLLCASCNLIKEYDTISEEKEAYLGDYSMDGAL